MNTTPLIGLAIALTAGLANAAEPLNLTFTRTGNDAASVTVAADLEGVNASLSSISHTLKAFGSTALCADANGSMSPTVVMSFSIAGLPADWSFNRVGLDIHAYNSQGGNQQHNDNKKRQFNVSVTSGGQTLATYTDLDPAAGIEGVRKVWEANTASAVSPGSSMELTITITKGTHNEGCFFGLEGITLSTDAPGVEPDPTPGNSKIYTIKWRNDTQSYMAEQADGSIAITDYATSNKIFWEFIPTDNADCYYIRNTASGKYIGSCNMAPGSSSRVTVSDSPVEYYVHLSASTEGSNKGCYWLSSTDCANYSDETQNARCLNKDGASDYVITWKTGVSNTGSYWTLTESDNLYEARPFTPQPTIGDPQRTYFIVDAQGRSYTHSGEWKTFSPTDNDAKWYFVGTSNIAGGYQIVNASDNTPINNGAHYRVTESEGVAPYHFVGPGDAQAMLSLAGVDSFNFIIARTAFALNNQIYSIPCGPIGDIWIAAATIGSDFRYPMATVSGDNLTQPTVTSKPQKFTVLSRDAATVHPGAETPLTVSLNQVPADAYQLIVCFDWNRDGLFEETIVLPASQTISTTFTVPTDAATGKTRIRLRLTSNGQTYPDADVNGQILDLLLNIAQPSAILIDPVAKTNDPTRGSAEWVNGTAKATSLGNALFLYWTEGMRIIGVDSSLDIAPSASPRVLTAVFTANTSPLDGIDNALLNSVDSVATIVYANGRITVSGNDAIAIVLYSINGSAVASATSSLDVTSVIPGIYIAKAITSAGVVSSKIKI